MPLHINSVFLSLDGEVNTFHQGCITTFIRLAGCNLTQYGGCTWCDSKQAQKESDTDKILTTPKQIKRFYTRLIKPIGAPKITITGGEPFMQEEGLSALLDVILNDKMKVTVETNGSIKPQIHHFNPYIGYIVDYKLPSSKMEKHMNFRLLRERKKKKPLIFAA